MIFILGETKKIGAQRRELYWEALEENWKIASGEFDSTALYF